MFQQSQMLWIGFVLFFMSASSPINPHIARSASFTYFANYSDFMQSKVLIKGRVVDIKGNPISKAAVSLEVVPESDLTTFTLTADDGTFAYETDVFPEKNIRNFKRLYVSPPLPRGTCNFIGAPYPDTPLDFYLRQAGRVIELVPGAVLQVGDVTPTVAYSVIELALASENGSPLLTQRQDWERVWIRIRDSQGNNISTSTIAKSQISNAVNLTDSSIKIAMPEGEWSFEFQTPKKRGAWSKPLKLKVIGSEMQRRQVYWN